MALITATTLNGIIDNCCGYYLDILGTSGSGYGYGTGPSSWGASTKATNIGTVISGSGDLTLISQLAQPTVALQTLATGVINAGNNLQPLLLAVQSNIVQNTPSTAVRNLDTYLTYLNTANSGSYWAALQNPAWSQLAPAWFVGATPSPWNIYAADPGAGVDAPYTGNLGDLVVGTGFTAGDTINSALYAGGFPAITVSGLTGTGLVTVTGTQRNPANYSVVTAAVTWTYTVTANGTFVLNNGTSATNSLILAVSGISAAGGISAGTITVIAQAPSGRPTEP